MQTHLLLFNPSNEWHEYKGCRLLRSRAVFAAKQGFLFVDDPCVEEISVVDEPSDSAMVAGYIILSKRTTLSVFRRLLPDTARFFFLSNPLLRVLRERRRPVPRWCAEVLVAMQALIDLQASSARALIQPIAVNKSPPECAEHTMSGGYYTGLACLVLFDARGPIESCSSWGSVYIIIAACISTLLLSLKYMPTIMHRPQQLVDALCNDVLCIVAHAACISSVIDPCLRHGCALHSMCFILQQRFMGHMPSAATGTVVHTTLILLLLSAYGYGPRISDVKQFMLSAVCPYALELLAQLLTNAHRMAVMSWCSAMDT
jgi:hypothetical protein